MRPAFSVVLLTTACGAAQGLLIALVGVELGGRLGWSTAASAGSGFYVVGACAALVLGVAGLAASFFHLGHPERAWRAVAMWRTSWLSRECLCLPVFLGCTGGYGFAHWLGSSYAFVIGVLGVCVSAALFVCTAMIYACLRFLREWASPLTLVNFVALGCASGATLATVCAAWLAPPMAGALAVVASVLTAVAALGRLAMLRRNARLAPKSSLASATGITSPNLRQTSRGFTAQSFNTREFFHGRSAKMLRCVKWGFLGGAFALPLALMGLGADLGGLAAVRVFAAAFTVQYAGLIAERWFFFAEARHPQNLYYGKG
ncbi:dimethyl sulfoxide reductase anchor subunit [Trinickia sp. LjRoot230]|uniref:dimethyl sulfoxide reductase anchor subunit family protein n=1 Tax=Trinickia sp. LjRoot230 TaxID=3342288 RepID=UPI003ED11465